MASANIPTSAVPGKILGSSAVYHSGTGTHIHDGQVVSSLLGVVTVREAPGTKSSTGAPGPAKRLTRLTGVLNKGEKATITVSRHAGKKHETLPDVGSTVLCRVVRLMPRQAIVSIQQVGETVLQTEWQGVIRTQDVRATEKDRVKIHESFKPGDVVRAQVISLGDQANYYLSTASNELGVIMATSEAGNDMIPVSWKEYLDPETEVRELRKVAKPN
ncbi:exoribonuclease CSL4 [Plectosphaerella cucumerina]|uniref:Exoribonuclease CSL4 n=1 Tax=Plectosphaerella cucumerina TaxID=40658 RepID=A0A8K0TGE1_9PEZI|nr:exoribonuclease CSL4 [Plectosphaerella cucumerina]